MNFLQQLERFLARETGDGRGDGIVVGFSGGADSTALLWGLEQLAPRLDLDLVAAHLDHGLDEASDRRCEAARKIAAQIGVAFTSDRREVHAGTGSDGPEAEARRARYGYLDEVRNGRGFGFIATAHHRDDQAETVLLRMQFGSGPLGLAGIRRRDGCVLRPLLGMSRRELRSVAQASGVAWVEDPTNHDLARPRNRLRHHTMGALSEDTDDLVRRLDRLATTAARARRAIRLRLEDLLQPAVSAGQATVSLTDVARLGTGLLNPALALLHELAGAAYPPPKAAVAELARQIAAKRRIGCDCGDFWRWEVRDDRLRVVRKEPRPPLFTYTL